MSTRTTSRGMRATVFLLSIALAALIAAGCGAAGGSKASSAQGLDFVPSSALGYIVIDADFEGADWKKFEKLARSFPDYDKGKKDLVKEVNPGDDDKIKYDEDIKPWLGDEIGLALVSVKEGAAADKMASKDDAEVLIWVTASDDAKAKRFFNSKAKEFAESKKDGTSNGYDIRHMTDGEDMWWTYRDSMFLGSTTKAGLKKAIATKKSGKSIGDNESVKSAADKVEDGALVSFVLSGAGLRDMVEDQLETLPNAKSAESALDSLKAFKAASAGFMADDDGFRLRGFAGVDAEAMKKYGGTSKNFKPTLMEGFPSSTLLGLNAQGLGPSIKNMVDQLASANPQMSQQLSQMEGAIGVKVDDLATLFNGQFGMAVTKPAAGSPLPNAAFVAETTDETKTDAMLDKIMALVGAQASTPPKDVTVAGEKAKQIGLANGAIPLNFLTIDGKFVVTNGDGFLTASSGDKLGDSDAYKSAIKAAGVPDEVGALVYLDMPAVAEVAGSLPGATNTEDLKMFGPWVMFAETSDDHTTMDVYMGINKKSGDDA